jgi:hypothetical protein
MLTYAKSFRSASGVLAVAAWFRKTVIASAGESALLSLVRKYQLGCVVEPDQAEAIANGMKLLLTDAAPLGWSDYLRDNGWEKNATTVIAAMERSTGHS